MFGASRKKWFGRTSVKVSNNNYFNNVTVSYNSYMELYHEAMRMQRVALNKQSERDLAHSFIKAQREREKVAVSILRDSDVDPEIVRKIILTLKGK